MTRCAVRAWAAAVVAVAAASPALAQQIRTFPPVTLRTAMVFGDFPNVTINNRSAQLSPGSRIRDQNNHIVLPASLNGSKALVNYTLGLNEGQIQDVWILRPEEAAISPWPHTPDEARTWTYDATAHTWTKP